VVFRFLVTMSAPHGSTVTVRFATISGSARAGRDFVARSGILSFRAGTTRRAIHVRVLGDTVVEGNEAFRVRLSRPDGVTIGNGVARGVIANDD
jgi:chitinase